MRGMFEHVYRAKKEPAVTKRHILDHGFTIITESAQRPRDQITEATAVKKRKLAESKEVITDRKEKKLQEKAKKEDKRKVKELQKQAVDNAKKAKAAATAAKAREWKKRRVKPPIEA
jgi:hypothetical protein